jgi:Uma2 family endonuclease
MSAAAPMSSIVSGGELHLRRFSVDEYHRMIEAGILKEDDPIELLEGLLVTKMVRNPPHDLALSLVEAALASSLSSDWFCRIQSAVTTLDSEPEPDVAVVRGPRRRYAEAHPTPADVALIVEIADASLARDRTDKARLYANAGIREYWIVNLVDGVVELHRDPDRGSGSFAVRLTIGRDGEIVTMATGREIRIAAVDLLP